MPQAAAFGVQSNPSQRWVCRRATGWGLVGWAPPRRLPFTNRSGLNLQSNPLCALCASRLAPPTCPWARLPAPSRELFPLRLAVRVRPPAT